MCPCICVYVFVFVFVSPVRWAGLSAFENQDDVIGRLLQLFPRLLAVSQRVDELLVRIFVIRVCEGVWLFGYHTYPLYISYISNVCIMHIQC